MTDELIAGDAFDKEVAEFDRSRHQVFEHLALLLKQASAAPAEADFGRVVAQAQKILSKSDLELSQLFKVSRPTINRWVRGVTAPHPMLKRAVLETFIAEVRTALKGLRTN